MNLGLAVRIFEKCEECIKLAKKRKKNKDKRPISESYEISFRKSRERWQLGHSKLQYRSFKE